MFIWSDTHVETDGSTGFKNMVLYGLLLANTDVQACNWDQYLDNHGPRCQIPDTSLGDASVCTRNVSRVLMTEI